MMSEIREQCVKRACEKAKELLTFNEFGTIQDVSMTVFDETKFLIKKLKEFENSSTFSSTQFVQQVSKSELFDSIKNMHSKEVEEDFKQKLETIENAADCPSNFMILVDTKNGDNSITKFTLILSVTKSIGRGEKIYDCFIHSLKFEVHLSLAQVIICAAVTIGLSTLFANQGHRQSAIMCAAVGTIVSSLVVKPLIPEFAEEAMNLILVETLHAKGWLIEHANKHVFSVPRVVKSGKYSE